MANEKITELTEEQKVAMHEHAEKWIKIGLATGPADRKVAEAAICDAYRKVGLEPPPVFHWVLSPMEGYKMAESFVPGSGYSCCFGQADAHWLAFYTFFAEHLNVEKAKDVLPLAEAAKQVSWWWPYDEACIVSERPDELRVRTENNRSVLHNTEGPAVRFRDGYSIFSVNGIRVPEKVIKREYTAKDIQDENNAEVRRVMTELYGEARFIQDIGAKLVKKDDVGELYRVDFPDDEPIVMVKVVNSTPEPDGEFKIYWLGVPDNIKTPRQGIAWTFGMTEDEYYPQQET